MWLGDASTSCTSLVDAVGGGEGETNLVLVEDGPEGVEQLEGRHDLALYERGGENRRCRPPAGAEWHLPEPGLEGKPACAPMAPIWSISMFCWLSALCSL